MKSSSKIRKIDLKRAAVYFTINVMQVNFKTSAITTDSFWDSDTVFRTSPLLPHGVICNGRSCMYLTILHIPTYNPHNHYL